MTFSEAVKSGFDHYTKFDGRAGRPAYWWWFLFAILVGIGANIIDAILGSFGVVSGLAALALLLPNLSVAIRRLHDIDQSGWWSADRLSSRSSASSAGWSWFLREGDPGENDYGPPPAAGTVADSRHRLGKFAD